MGPVTKRNQLPYEHPFVGDLRIWWIPQVPMKEPFYWSIDPKGTEEEIIINAINILNMLAEYDLWQLENNIKPDFSNAGGLEIYCSDNEWEEWESKNGRSINDIIRNRS